MRELLGVRMMSKQNRKSIGNEPEVHSAVEIPDNLFFKLKQSFINNKHLNMVYFKTES